MKKTKKFRQRGAENPKDICTITIEARGEKINLLFYAITNKLQAFDFVEVRK